MSKTKLIVSWVFQATAAVILAQTLYFKFSGSEESRLIFSMLGVEPWGRWAAGCAEAAAVILLLVPRTAAAGAMVTLGIITGAILSHLVRLGIEVNGDGGLLFGLAVATLVSAGLVAWLRRAEVPILGQALFLPASKTSV